MKSKCVAHEASQRTFILVLDPGEEAFGAISRFAEQERFDGAALTALGAFEPAKLGWFDPKEKKYRSIPIEEQCEVLSLIGPAAVIGKGVVLGSDCRIGSHVSMSHALLGARVYVYPGARIGQEGFGFDATPQGFRTIPQLDCVIIEDDVEIGANPTIDRGALDATAISLRLLACSCKDVGQLEQPIRHQLRPYPPRSSTASWRLGRTIG